MIKETIHNILLKLRCSFELKVLIVILFLLFVSYIGHAQKQSQDSLFLPNLQIGISAGPSTFFGDIKQNQILPSSDYINEWRFAYGLNINYNISSVFTIRFQGLYGELAGSRKTENIWFENDYFEFNFSTTININNLFSEKRDNRLASLYGVAGFGLLNYNTVVKRMDEYYVLKRVGYGQGTGIDGRYRQEFIMLGAGVEFRVNKRIRILLETVNKIPFSDILDGVESGHYNDSYNYTSLGVSYRFAFLKKDMPDGIYPTDIVLPTIAKVSSADINYELRSELVYQPIIRVVTPSLPKQEKAVIPSKIEFRVQILAEYGKPYSKSWISENYNIPLSEIKENIVNGYYIYTVGSFPTYEMASEKSAELQTYNGIYGAFVVAFRDGKRIYPRKK